MNDLTTFSQTSTEPYDRHTYEVVLKSGKKVKFDYYEQVQEYWFLHNQLPDYLDTIIVKDRKKKKGFS